MNSRYSISFVQNRYCPCLSIGNYNAKPISFVCVMIFTFHQSYYILQFLTIDHYCPVPVDSMAVSKFTPSPLTPPMGSKVTI